MKDKKKIVVAVSGTGRSLQNLIDYAHSRTDAEYEISGVISSHAGCHAEEIARTYGIQLFSGNFSKKNPNLSQQLRSFIHSLGDIRLLVLAGFIKLFPNLEDVSFSIINIHPALLPKFGGKGMYGMAVHTAVSQSGDKMSGATIHYVTGEYDQGQIIARYCISIDEIRNSPEAIAHSVFEAEKRLLPHIINEILAGRIYPNSKQLPLSFFNGDLLS